MPGIAIESTATAAAERRETNIRARKYVGIAASDITIAFTYLTAA